MCQGCFSLTLNFVLTPYSNYLPGYVHLTQISRFQKWLIGFQIHAGNSKKQYRSYSLCRCSWPSKWNECLLNDFVRNLANPNCDCLAVREVLFHNQCKNVFGDIFFLCVWFTKNSVFIESNPMNLSSASSENKNKMRLKTKLFNLIYAELMFKVLN